MKVSFQVFACYTSACRPPTSGGTGGSSGGKGLSSNGKWSKTDIGKVVHDPDHGRIVVSSVSGGKAYGLKTAKDGVSYQRVEISQSIVGNKQTALDRKRGKYGSEAY